MIKVCLSSVENEVIPLVSPLLDISKIPQVERSAGLWFIYLLGEGNVNMVMYIALPLLLQKSFSV